MTRNIGNKHASLTVSLKYWPSSPFPSAIVIQNSLWKEGVSEFSGRDIGLTDYFPNKSLLVQGRNVFSFIEWEDY
jgi:hypothetical protein